METFIWYKDIFIWNKDFFLRKT